MSPRGVRPKPLPCPWCDSRLSRVRDVREEPTTLRDRATYSGEGLWRRRRCETCHRDFTTEERVTGVYPPSPS